VRLFDITEPVGEIEKQAIWGFLAREGAAIARTGAKVMNFGGLLGSGGKAAWDAAKMGWKGATAPSKGIKRLTGLKGLKKTKQGWTHQAAGGMRVKTGRTRRYVHRAGQVAGGLAHPLVAPLWVGLTAAGQLKTRHPITRV